ncbi:MAG TPA: metalloregulator ArsR/SmtB family transcription factor [Streptosporangiaceae bacterium]|nr:metalloregulator ArsR/SmtB family transcription factor [Streptosporangiaceae bacterium]
MGSERGTRGRIARLILEHGPITTVSLSARTGLTPAAVRRHLDNLLADHMIEARNARRPASRGRGRPAKVFAITDTGRNAFGHAYDDLATSALRFLAEVAGPDAVAEFARRQVAELERKYRPVMAAAAPGDEVKVLAQALSEDGYAATAGSAPGVARTVRTTDPGSTGTSARAGAPARAAGPSLNGEQLCQHHCPVSHVAAVFPQLCEAETEAFARLLGTPVQRLATIAHGDGICTTHVTAPSLVHGAPSASHHATHAGVTASLTPTTTTHAAPGGIPA